MALSILESSEDLRREVSRSYPVLDHSSLHSLYSYGGLAEKCSNNWSILLFNCRLHSHCNDPSLEDPIPQEYALYLCPAGPLNDILMEFWRESRCQCGKNKAHENFPHITLSDFFTVSYFCVWGDNGLNGILVSLTVVVVTSLAVQCTIWVKLKIKLRGNFTLHLC